VDAAEFVVMVPISGDAHRSNAGLGPRPGWGRQDPRCVSHWVDRGRVHRKSKEARCRPVR